MSATNEELIVAMKKVRPEERQAPKERASRGERGAQRILEETRVEEAQFAQEERGRRNRKRAHDDADYDPRTASSNLGSPGSLDSEWTCKIENSAAKRLSSRARLRQRADSGNPDAQRHLGGLKRRGAACSRRYRARKKRQRTELEAPHRQIEASRVHKTMDDGMDQTMEDISEDAQDDISNDAEEEDNPAGLASNSTDDAGETDDKDGSSTIDRAGNIQKAAGLPNNTPAESNDGMDIDVLPRRDHRPGPHGAEPSFDQRSDTINFAQQRSSSWLTPTVLH